MACLFTIFKKIPNFDVIDRRPLLVSAHASSQVCTQAEGTVRATVHEGHGTFKELFVLHFGQRIRYK